MKNLKVLSLALCLTCLPVQIYGAAETVTDVVVEPYATSVTQFRGLFTDTDRQFVTLYPGTLKGFDQVDDRVVPAARAVHAGFREVTPQQMQEYRDYNFRKFFEFMEGLRRIKPAETAGDEFNTLYNKIYTEAAEAARNPLTEIKWHLFEIMFIRGLLLASGNGSEEAQDLLSTVPDMEHFFGALRDTPAYLMGDTGGKVPAWKTGLTAMLVNGEYNDTRGADVHKDFINLEEVHCKYADVKKELNRYGLAEKIYLPIVGLGKIGITTLTKMWLHTVFGVPLTYDEYTAHGIELGTAVGALHDEAHGIVDNRRREVMKATINLLKKVVVVNKPVKRALPLAARHMVERYNAFNETLLAYIETKERTAIDELTAAIALAPELDARRAAEKEAHETHREDADALARALASAKELAPDEGRNRNRHAAEIAARRKYNMGVAALFHTLHEVYAMRANVLEAPTLAEAITRLCTNATSKDDTEVFDELETFINPSSDLNDAEIFERLKRRKLASIGIYTPYKSGEPAPTIGDYVSNLDLESLKVHRGPVYTEVTFDTNAGKAVKIQVPTTRYLVNTAKDENAVLALVGQKVPEVVMDIDTLRTLPKDHADRTAALAQMQEWLTTVDKRTNTMVAALTADVLANLPTGALARYDVLVASQNAEWEAAYPPVVTAPVLVPSAVSVDVSAGMAAVGESHTNTAAETTMVTAPVLVSSAVSVVVEAAVGERNAHTAAETTETFEG